MLYSLVHFSCITQLSSFRHVFWCWYMPFLGWSTQIVLNSLYRESRVEIIFTEWLLYKATFNFFFCTFSFTPIQTSNQDTSVVFSYIDLSASAFLALQVSSTFIFVLCDVLKVKEIMQKELIEQHLLHRTYFWYS